MLDLALHGENGPVILRDVSKRQSISEKYLWQVISPLKSAGLIKTVRGAKGGYELARDPSTITVRDILVVLEGSPTLVLCVESPSICKDSATCVTRDIWARIGQALDSAMSATSLADMVQLAHAKEKATHYAYSI